MAFYILWIIALGLSMDAFAVSISKGLAMRSFRWKQAVIIALCFGCFQAIMPLIGYVLGSQFSKIIQEWDHWFAFILLLLIGANMIREGFTEEEREPVSEIINVKRLLSLGLATSVDVLAVGISFAFLHVNIIQAVWIIGITTFVISFIGVKSGHFLGRKFKSKAEIFGGLVIIIMGIKILFEHDALVF
ncbi:manganese efflux pump MntP family protein [Rodentibacter pneumotropicus]|uniref:manganese efflux pump MntP n=1 Tax=Rodentibacter pneumotropicus TaxID=758 RepID=UPI00109C7F30|nr:manganese efflux pump MntP family protein [Rodentibacter pneumotropicus]THA16473.1 manganese efflux pump [Rodentibacter pneumotropicus]